MKRLLISILFMAAVPGRGETIETPLCSTPVECVLSLFKQVSKFNRPSLGETPLKEAIVHLALQMQVRWTDLGSLQIASDKWGNLLIRLPGTGRFAGLKLPYVGIQSHMDMVQNVEGVGPKEDLRPYFQNGVDVVEDPDGAIHSRDYKTTLGADNGIGVATQLRYLVDPSIEHPPLELLFTVSEEQNGMLGAKEFRIERRAPYLINLDHEGTGTVCFGCMGSERKSLYANNTFDRVGGGYSLLTLSISDLVGEHSGLFLHLPRANTTILAGHILDAAFSKTPKVQLALLKTGDPGKLSEIPKSLQMQILMPSELGEAVVEAIHARIADYMSNLEDASTYQAGWHLQPAQEKTKCLSARLTRRLIALKDIPNNTIEVGDPKEYPHGLLAGSSIGYGEVSVQPTGMHYEFAYMARGYRASAIHRTSATVHSAIVDAIGRGNTRVSNLVASPKWDGDRDSLLVKLAFQAPGIKSAQRIAGGLELAYLAEGRDAIALGASIPGVHSPKETIYRQDVEQVIGALDYILKEFPASCPSLLAQQGRANAK